MKGKNGKINPTEELIGVRATQSQRNTSRLADCLIIARHDSGESRGIGEQPLEGDAREGTVVWTPLLPWPNQTTPVRHR